MCPQYDHYCANMCQSCQLRLVCCVKTPCEFFHQINALLVTWPCMGSWMLIDCLECLCICSCICLKWCIDVVKLGAIAQQ